MADTTAITSRIDDLLLAHGVPIGEQIQASAISTIHVGCTWCRYFRVFDITIPRSFEPLIAPLRTAFTGYRVTVSDWSHLGEAGSQYIHFSAYVR